MRFLSSLTLVLVCTFVIGCGSSQVGKCGDADEECCFLQSEGVLACNAMPDSNRLTCQSFTNGSFYCLRCGHPGQACCNVAGGAVCIYPSQCTGPPPAGSSEGGTCS
jgi:hypothetical protein